MPNERILIVDDEKDVLDLCKRILQTQGYEVKTADNGFEAVEVAKHERFDLLLTDIKMPGMTGLEIAQVLKDQDPDLICVTMTGFSTMDMAISAVKLGINEFILKPFTPRELSDSVTRALEKERLRQENFRLKSLIPLFELNKSLLSTVEVDQVFKQLMEIASKETKAQLSLLFKVGSNRQLIPHSSNSAASSEQQLAAATMAQQAVNAGQQLYVSLDEATAGQRRLLMQFAATSIIATPLNPKKSCLGALVVACRDGNFAPGDNEFLSVLCGQAGIALENARLFSETQSAYEQLRQLDHMKSEFINIAAHELRTPLAILLGYASVLDEEVDDLQKMYVANIIRNAMRLRGLIDDMLNLRYLESGIGQLMHDPLLLREAVQELTQDVSLLIQEKKLNISIHIPADFPEMIADRQKFDLIMTNLVHNAAKFTPQEGSINFSAKVIEDKAHISVHNTGSHIPADKLEKVFEPFFQIEHSLTREHGGAGLGLTIVRGMVRVCSGEVWAESDEQTGTSFTFSLPLDNSSLRPRKLVL